MRTPASRCSSRSSTTWSPSSPSASRRWTIDGSVQLPLGQWTHVAVTLSAAEATGRLYVNGRQVGAGTGMTLTPSSLGETTGNWIGRSQANNSDPFLNAAVDEFQIRAAALAEDEIRELLVSAGGEPQSLVAWYRFEDDGQVAGDHSGGGRD